MNFDIILQNIEVRQEWMDRYKYYVPKFINEAISKSDWQDWEPEIFIEFFEKSKAQCISSLQQGYYTNSEQTKIKENWKELSPMLKRIAENQEFLDHEYYYSILDWLRQYTTQNRSAAGNRLIASLQPNLLSTIVQEDRLKTLMVRINSYYESPVFNIQNDWFANSNAVLEFFKGKIPHDDIMDIMTYPWETYDYLNELNNQQNGASMNTDDNHLEDVKTILLYKKQIILQGPPGTGKTRMAEEIAKLMIKDNEQEVTKKTEAPFMSDLYIQEKLQNLSEVASSSGRTKYEISNALADRCTVTLEIGTSYVIPYTGIKKAYEDKLWLGGQKNGFHPYNAAIAKYLSENKETQLPKQESNEPLKDYEIIQFHPSFSYEDFVRGITVKTVGNQIVYNTENKLLGKIAKKANDNLIKSRQPVEQNLKQKWVEEKLTLFGDYVQQTIDEYGKFSLTDNVGIVAVDEDAFRYTGDNWAAENTNRMRFFDVITAMMTNVGSRQDIKKHKEMSGSAIQHATYYYNLLEKFKAQINEPIPDKFPNEKATKVKNYVLIIDEINRANLPAVLGELIYALEYRGTTVKIAYDIDGKYDFVLPANLYIIGTMNTADRSVGHIDYAIRRRFAFVDVLPKILDEATLEGKKFALDTFIQVSKLFVENNIQNASMEEPLKPSEHLSEEFRPEDIWLGHSYFIHDENEFDIRLKYEIIPILKEYVKDGILKESARELINDLSK